MLRIEITFLDGRTEIVDYPSSHRFCDLRRQFSATSVRILSYTP